MSAARDARRIHQLCLRIVRADFAGSVDAVVLTGRLATGGYVAGPSDVEIVHNLITGRNEADQVVQAGHGLGVEPST